MSPVPAEFSPLDPLRASASRLTPEEERLKREIYERLNPRRRKFIDRLGYDVWDPFQKPNDPLDLRTDVTRRTTQQLVREFFHALGDGEVGNDFRKGALDAALGVVNKDEHMLGAYAFFRWYDVLMKKEGFSHEM